MNGAMWDGMEDDQSGTLLLTTRPEVVVLTLWDRLSNSHPPITAQKEVRSWLTLAVTTADCLVDVEAYHPPREPLEAPVRLGPDFVP